MNLSPSPTSAKIMSFYRQHPLSPDLNAYLKDHVGRFAFLLSKVDQIVKKQEIKSILDIGISFETEMLRLIYPKIPIDSLGYYDKRFLIRSGDGHTQFNLNQAQFKKNWSYSEEYDLIIMAEVIEHLHTSPKLVLGCVSSWLKPGGLLIIQTPNAVSLKRRLKMLLGKNPFEMIRETPRNPGHYREYTLEELKNIGLTCNLKVADTASLNFYRHQNTGGYLYNFICSLLPGTFKDGLYICFSK